MKTHISILSLAILSLAGAAVAAVAGAQDSPVPGPVQQSPVLPLGNAVSFICNDGQLVVTDRDQIAGVLRVIRSGETIVLQEQLGHTPTRFVRDSSRVDLGEASAQIYRGFGSNARQIADCARVPAAPSEGTVWGTLVKPDRMALPSGTRAKVLLVDAARADAPAIELGSTTLATLGNQVPLHFLIRFDPARTAAPARPMLQARIDDGTGKLLYVTGTANPIPNAGAAASPIELKLVRTGGQ
ncbi:MAG: YbaY family lipoprotein [Sandaracinobacteroides sp.]